MCRLNSSERHSKISFAFPKYKETLKRYKNVRRYSKIFNINNIQFSNLLKYLNISDFPEKKNVLHLKINDIKI